jgi:hypothetical protein
MAWWPDVEIQTAHYTVRSDERPEQAQATAIALEALHEAYLSYLSDLPGVLSEHGPLEVRLYANRAEFRRCNPHVGWAEAFYDGKRCHAYLGPQHGSPQHWVLHEATHQLNREVAALDVPKWMEEGLATFFGSSRYGDGVLEVGRPDPDSYPVWWLYDLGLSGDLERDLAGGKVIPLRAVVTGEGGPDLDEELNLYYIQWWALTHWLLEGDAGRRRDAYLRTMRDGGGLAALERRIGPLEEIEPRVYGYLHEWYLKAIGGKLAPR